MRSETSAQPAWSVPTLDSRLLVATPEGVDLELIPAGPLARALAYLVDLVLRALLMLVAAIVLAQLGEFGGGLLLLVFFLLEWIYPVLYEALRGATPGKRWMRLQVVTADGLPPSWAAICLRNLLRVVDFLPLAYILGLVVMLVSGRFQRLGDLAADTLVVYLPPAAAPLPGNDIEPLALPFAVTLDERQAILDFAARSNQLSTDRQCELAAILATALREADPEACRQRLLAGAHHLAGTRRGTDAGETAAV